MYTVAATLLLVVLTLSQGLDIDDSYCQILFQTQTCLGIGQDKDARLRLMSVDCSKDYWRFRRFKDGSLRPLGFERFCFRTVKAEPTKPQLLKVGKCKGVYTFKIKKENNGAYRLLSMHPDYRNFFVALDTGEGGDDLARLTTEDNTPNNAGQYFTVTNCVSGEGGFLIEGSSYVKCPRNHYCPTYKSKKECPNGGKSPAGSSKVESCTRKCRCERNIRLVGNEKLSCNRVLDGCECDESD